jgi:outer membrane protein
MKYQISNIKNQNYKSLAWPGQAKFKNFTFCIVILIFAFWILNLGGRTACYAAAGLKVGYLDVGKVFDEYKKTKDQDSLLEKDTKVKQADRDKLVSEITRLRDEMELLSEKGKQDKQVIIDEKVKKLQEFDRAAKTDLKKKRDDMVTDILKDIDKVVQAYGKKEGYDMIFNDKVIVYKTDGMDITNDIIKILNSQQASEK